MVLDIELIDLHVIKNLALLRMGNFTDPHFVLRKLGTHKTSSLLYEKLARNSVE